MKLISHRGNLFGPDKINENRPDYIITALSNGYDAEVDVWLDKDQKIYLGHDSPQYLIDENFILDNSDRLWLHCKNIEAMYMFSTKMPESNFFWHENDKFTLTSKNIIWTYPGKEVTPVSVMVHLDPIPSGWETDEGMYGICSDYIGRINSENAK
jgi:hypothetical protein